MRAFLLRRYGGPENVQWGELPTPQPAAGELLVRVHAAGLNPVDYKTREGQLKPILPLKLPAVLGNELAGTVEGLGAGVAGFEVGDRIYARIDKGEAGAIADYVCINQRVAAKMPTHLDFPAAAGVPLAALTALQCLREVLNVQPGQHIFINGGAGGVGTFAIQLAKWMGATVTTTASPRGDALVRRLGADRVVDYTKENFWDVLKDVDGVFDVVGPPTLGHCFKVVKRCGTVVSVAGTPEPGTAGDVEAGPMIALAFWFISLPLRMKAAAHGSRYRFKLMHPSGEQLAELTTLLEQGKIEVVLDQVFPAAQAAEAFALLEGGRAKGKIVIDLMK